MIDFEKTKIGDKSNLTIWRQLDLVRFFSDLYDLSSRWILDVFVAFLENGFDRRPLFSPVDRLLSRPIRPQPCRTGMRAFSRRSDGGLIPPGL
jgi:hypothetical protein